MNPDLAGEHHGVEHHGGEHHGGEPINVTVTGEVDVYTSDQLHRTLTSASTRSSHVVADLSAVTFLDSTGLTVLVTAHRQLDDEGGRLDIVNPSKQVRRVLELTGLIDVLHVTPGREPRSRRPRT